MTGINDLPAEILGLIFHLRSTNDSTRSSNLRLGKYLSCSNGSFHHKRAPFVFLRVCRYWRSIAVATPLLWSSLDATMESHINGTPRAVMALQYWLSLSCSAPLSFFLQTELEEEDALQEAASAHSVAMLGVLANESYRWQSAALHMDLHLAEAFVDMLSNQFDQTSLSTLRRLEITAHGDRAMTKALASAIGTIQSLNELYLVLYTPKDDMPTLLKPIPWYQLTTIFLSICLPIDQVAFFLAQSTAAVTATFSNVEGASDTNADTERCTLPKLQSLTMSGSLSVLAVLDRFNFPNLNNLTVTSTSLTYCDSLSRLMEQSKPPIRHIALRVKTPWALRGPDLAQFLRIPTLRQVSHVEFGGWDIPKIAEDVIAQLKEEIPALWSWKRWQEGDRVGWKPHFDYVDKCVTRIIPAPQIL